MFPHLTGADNQEESQCRDRTSPKAAHLTVWITDPKRDVVVGRGCRTQIFSPRRVACPRKRRPTTTFCFGSAIQIAR